MKNTSTRTDTVNNNEPNDTATKLRQLRESATRLQQEIDGITKQIKELELKVDTRKEETDQAENTTNTRLSIRQRIQYNRKAGKPLNIRSAHNPRGTIVSITQQWIHFRTDDGDIKYRAPKNIKTIEETR